MQDEVNEKTMALCIKGGKNLGTDSESSTDKAAGRDLRSRNSSRRRWEDRTDVERKAEHNPLKAEYFQEV